MPFPVQLCHSYMPFATLQHTCQMDGSLCHLCLWPIQLLAWPCCVNSMSLIADHIGWLMLALFVDYCLLCLMSKPMHVLVHWAWVISAYGKCCGNLHCNGFQPMAFGIFLASANLGIGPGQCLLWLCSMVIFPLNSSVLSNGLPPLTPTIWRSSFWMQISQLLHQTFVIGLLSGLHLQICSCEICCYKFNCWWRPSVCFQVSNSLNHCFHVDHYSHWHVTLSLIGSFPAKFVLAQAVNIVEQEFSKSQWSLFCHFLLHVCPIDFTWTWKLSQSITCWYHSGQLAAVTHAATGIFSPIFLCLLNRQALHFCLHSLWWCFASHFDFC